MGSARRTFAIASAVVMAAATAVATAAPAESSPSPGAVAKRAPLPPLALTTAAHKITVESYRHRVYANLGIYAVAGDEDFEVIASRTPDYKFPITGHIVTTGGDIDLPDGLLKSFRGLPGFTHLTITDKDGNAVVTRSAPFCPSGNSQRVRPDAPDVSIYPFECPSNPFTLGAVFGLDAGYAVPAVDPFGRALRLDPGRYTATVTIGTTYQTLLGLSPDDSTATVTLKVVKMPDCGGGSQPVPGRGCRAGQVPGSARPPAMAKPRAHAPVSAPTLAPDPSVEPDLRSLPAYAIQLTRHGYLRFAATVWNAGPSPLVVDGYRSTSDQDLMDAYQFFYDADGNPAGYDTAGAMEWDARPGHHHWHFEDFARYQLLDADGNTVVKSRKEAFCLANTDAVDYTVEGADWRPYNTDLSTSCGDYASLAVREVLLAGSGDTYYQSLPGQSFNVNDLPNGVYYVSVEANPHDVLQEGSTTNNDSRRKIRLMGTGAHRTVKVFPVGMVEAN